MRTGLLGLIAVGITLAAGAVANGQGKGKSKGKGSADSGVAVAVSVFTENDRRIIREYVGAMPASGLPPGLAKRGGDLPPGLEKQLRKKGHLPPGLDKRLSSFPPELERRLSPPCEGCTRAFVAGRAVLYIGATRVILDIFVPL